MSYKDTLADRTPVQILNIEPDDDAQSPPSGPIRFDPHDNPDISVDTSARFTTHEIVGGPVVRQKVGPDAIEITIRGACSEEVAQQIDKLREAKLCTLQTDRISGVRCQVASTSTDPLETGGAVDLDTGDLLYEYRINLVGIEVL